MQVVAAAKAQVVAQAKADCEELLVAIVQDKRVADEQEKVVNADAVKIGKEAEEANVIAQQVGCMLGELCWLRLLGDFGWGRAGWFSTGLER